MEDYRYAQPRAPLAIIVMGVSGSGKSTLAATLAAKLGRTYLEGDSFHSAKSIEKMRRGEPLGDQDRWPWLRRLGEAAAIVVRDEGMSILTCSALKKSYRDKLREEIPATVCCILLTADEDELERRLSRRKGHYMPATLLESQLTTLEIPDQQENTLTLNSGLKPDELCQRSMNWLINTAHLMSTMASLPSLR